MHNTFGSSFGSEHLGKIIHSIKTKFNSKMYFSVLMGFRTYPINKDNFMNFIIHVLERPNENLQNKLHF